jgi:hypothetical protein
MEIETLEQQFQQFLEPPREGLQDNTDLENSSYFWVEEEVLERVENCPLRKQGLMETK